ncbi:hypothetical protein BJ875DRAFT_206597 [Amylocarpus encephaloides]|uniref:F-box domain-containing protein n=1 Tax=Amylocarpus encephaloides TaxID=45428 RepID=A0A9P7YNB9_9HELO|nr:hypothetical protein BJ875DRAFT_206597 [Amylocarpus encephaloides]
MASITTTPPELVLWVIGLLQGTDEIATRNVCRAIQALPAGSLQQTCAIIWVRDRFWIRYLSPSSLRSLVNRESGVFGAFTKKLAISLIMPCRIAIPTDLHNNPTLSDLKIKLIGRVSASQVFEVIRAWVAYTGHIKRLKIYFGYMSGINPNDTTHFDKLVGSCNQRLGHIAVHGSDAQSMFECFWEVSNQAGALQWLDVGAVPVIPYDQVLCREITD